MLFRLHVLACRPRKFAVFRNGRSNFSTVLIRECHSVQKTPRQGGISLLEAHAKGPARRNVRAFVREVAPSWNDIQKRKQRKVGTAFYPYTRMPLQEFSFDLEWYATFVHEGMSDGALNLRVNTHVGVPVRCFAFES